MQRSATVTTYLVQDMHAAASFRTTISLPFGSTSFPWQATLTKWNSAGGLEQRATQARRFGGRPQAGAAAEEGAPGGRHGPTAARGSAAGLWEGGAAVHSPLALPV